MSRTKSGPIPRKPPRRKPPRPGQKPGNISTSPPAPSHPIGDDPPCKSFERKPNWLWKRKRKNNEQGMLQWWWHTKLDSNDRDMFNFMWLMMGAPLLILVVASGGNIAFVTLQILWAIWILGLGYRVLRRVVSELVDEYQDHIDIPPAQNDDTEDFFFVDRERGTPHVMPPGTPPSPPDPAITPITVHGNYPKKYKE